jgi:hypothetical protein
MWTRENKAMLMFKSTNIIDRELLLSRRLSLKMCGLIFKDLKQNAQNALSASLLRSLLFNPLLACVFPCLCVHAIVFFTIKEIKSTGTKVSKNIFSNHWKSGNFAFIVCQVPASNFRYFSSNSLLNRSINFSDLADSQHIM